MQTCQEARSPFTALSFNFSYKTTFSPAAFRASPSEREPVPELQREWAQLWNQWHCSRKGKARGVLESKEACCKGRGEEARGLVSQASRVIRGVLARRPTAAAQLQTGLLPGDLSAGLHGTVPGSSPKWLPIVPGT